MTSIIHADWVLRGESSPLSDAAVVVDRRGTILDVGSASDVLPRHEGVEVRRVRGVVFPGLVNAHTHVELSHLRGKVGGGRGFVPWVDTLVATRTESTPEDEAEAVALAVADLARFATVGVGEVTNSLAAVAALARTGLAGCIFHEVVGLDRAVVTRRIEGLRAELEERVPTWPSADLSYAPSPHTLYTLHADAAKTLLESAKAHGVRASVHLAEHPSERRAIEQGDGPIPDWFATRFKQTPEFPRRPLLDVADDVGALRPGVLLVHLTEARSDELERVARSGASVVFCPRSNLYIEGKLPPLLAALNAGLDVALGTDSLASNTSLDVLAEAKALADRFPSVKADDLFAMATWNGARALGRNDLGRIARGARPGIYAVETTEPIEHPSRWLLTHLGETRTCLVPRVAVRTAESPITERSA